MAISAIAIYLELAPCSWSVFRWEEKTFNVLQQWITFQSIYKLLAAYHDSES